jgi:hypothetical protein
MVRKPTVRKPTKARDGDRRFNPLVRDMINWGDRLDSNGYAYNRVELPEALGKLASGRLTTPIYIWPNGAKLPTALSKKELLALSKRTRVYIRLRNELTRRIRFRYPVARAIRPKKP